MSDPLEFHRAVRAAQLVQEAREHIGEAIELLRITNETEIENEELADTTVYLAEELSDWPNFDIENASALASHMIEEAGV